MADRVLLIGWNHPVRGLEERAIETFNESIGLLGRRQQEGRIDGFEIMLMAPNSNVGGLFLVHGSAQQIHDLRDDDEFQRATTKAQLVADGVRHIEGVTGQAVARQVEMFQQVIAGVPQHA